MRDFFLPTRGFDSRLREQTIYRGRIPPPLLFSRTSQVSEHRALCYTIGMERKSFWLTVLLTLWILVTIFYAIVVFGLLVPIPIGLLVLFITYYTGFAVPMVIFSSNLASAGSYYYILAFAIVGVIISIVALARVKKNWKWSFSFIGLPIVSWLITISNVVLKICIHPWGDGGLEPGCNPPLGPGVVLSNVANSAVLLAIAILILIITKKQQENSGIGRQA